MIKTIKDKIITEVNTVDDIVNTYGYITDRESGGFPYACVIWTGEEAEVFTNTQDRITDTFEIKVVQEKLKDFKGKLGAETTTENRTDSILGVFRTNYTLDGLALRTTPIEINKNYDDGSTRIIISIIIKVERLVDIN